MVLGTTLLGIVHFILLMIRKPILDGTAGSFLFLILAFLKLKAAAHLKIMRRKKLAHHSSASVNHILQTESHSLNCQGMLVPRLVVTFFRSSEYQS